MEYELVPGEKLKTQFLFLVESKFLFMKKSVYKEITYFVCYDDQCSVRLKVDNRGNCVYVNENIHLHDHHLQIFLKWKLVNEIKCSIRTTTMTPKEAFDESCNKPIYQNVARELEFYSMKSTLHRIKRKECPSEPTANNIPDFFDNEHVMTRFGQTIQVNPDVFYRGCVGNGENDVSCVFASETIIKKIRLTAPAERKYYIDGTFYVVPAMFYQLVIMTFQVDNTTFPFLYVLMTGKKRAHYEKLLEFINENIVNLQPAQIMLDFEVGLRLAIKKVFPECELKGCFFHFGQCQQKFVAKQSRLFAEIRNNPIVKRLFHKFLSLALLPATNILEGFEILKSEARILGNLFDEYLIYFQRYWIDKVI